MYAGRIGEYVMEVIHTVENADRKFQFLRDGNKYTVAWDAEKLIRWMSRDAMIGWSLIPTTSDIYREMDKFILGYFPEGLVALVVLENL